ncbi:hypothetical protein [Corynebacterium durum]|uniref:hypothetical protein n=1 Tax=Corynebacterium durum TaxID=61592 RepID=UPI004027EB06
MSIFRAIVAKCLACGDFSTPPALGLIALSEQLRSVIDSWFEADSSCIEKPAPYLQKIYNRTG